MSGRGRRRAAALVEENDFLKRKRSRGPRAVGQTHFTCVKVTGWGWKYASTILDDDSHHVIAWKRRTTVKATEVTA